MYVWSTVPCGSVNITAVVIFSGRVRAGGGAAAPAGGATAQIRDQEKRGKGRNLACTGRWMERLLNLVHRSPPQFPPREGWEGPF